MPSAAVMKRTYWMRDQELNEISAKKDASGPLPERSVKLIIKKWALLKPCRFYKTRNT